MASEHEHEWTYVTDAVIDGPLVTGEMVSFPPETLLARFCSKCELRQALTPTLAVAEISQEYERLEQQLTQAREEIATLQEYIKRQATANVNQARDYRLVTEIANAQPALIEENATMRALLERTIASRDLFFVPPPELDKLADEVRAFLAEHPTKE